MKDVNKITSALISVYHKNNLEPLIRQLNALGITIYATGGTREFIEELKIPVIPVETVTDYPSILGGRVKTLHPKIFGGILSRRENPTDLSELEEYHIPGIDLVVVDLYPFEETVASGASEQDIIEKIDIGGISLIRAAAKNFKDVLIIPSREHYAFLETILDQKQGSSDLSDRRMMAAHAFNISSHYDTAIFNYFNEEAQIKSFKQSILESKPLRYGENPHQQGMFYGRFEDLFEQLHGKELSYNNLLDVDAAVSLMAEFDEPTIAILKHNNACGVASRPTLSEAWRDALAGDPVSAFGGIIIANQPIDEKTARLISELFFEVLIAPSYEEESLKILGQRKNRILLIQKPWKQSDIQFRSLLNGVVEQERDSRTERPVDMVTVTKASPDEAQLRDMVFANKLVKHTKSNTIVLAKNSQLIASGTGQTSRVDALRQAVEKSRQFGFDLNGAVMASDAFFPFPDCVEIAAKEGIKAIVQPGGSVKDKESIEACDKHGIAMVMTGVRHFKH